MLLKKGYWDHNHSDIQIGLFPVFAETVKVTIITYG
jgi:hypothetical protein